MGRWGCTVGGRSRKWENEEEGEAKGKDRMRRRER